MPPIHTGPKRITRKRLHPMIRQHEILLEVLGNPALPDTLQRLIDDGAVRKKWAANALTSARTAGFAFPDGAEVSFDEHARGWEVEIRVYEAPYTYIFGFDSIKGFYYK